MKALPLIFLAAALVAQQPDLATRVAQLEQQVAAAESAQAALAETLRGIDGALAAASERAAIHASEIPALELPEDPLAALDHIHEHGTQIAKSATQVRAPDGRLIDATLLHIGHIGFCYSSDDALPAIALAAPADASGYRWRELPLSEIAAAVDAAINGAKYAPLDVSGTLRVESQIGSRGIGELVETGGAVMLPLLLVAVLAVLMILERCGVLYRQRTGGLGLMPTVLAHCRAGEWADAEATCAGLKGVLPRTLLACLQRRRSGPSLMEDSIQEQLLHEVPRLRRRLNGIAVLAAIAPLLGLLGTVTGIIHTFETISAHGNTHPGMMAGGISEALFTTAAGLIIAIPVLLIHAMLNARVERIVSDTERHAATLLNTIVETSGER